MPLEPGAELALIELIEVPPLSRELIPTELFEGVALDEDVSMLKERETPSFEIARMQSGLSWSVVLVPALVANARFAAATADATVVAATVLMADEVALAALDASFSRSRATVIFFLLLINFNSAVYEDLNRDFFFRSDAVSFFFFNSARYSLYSFLILSALLPSSLSAAAISSFSSSCSHAAVFS